MRFKKLGITLIFVLSFFILLKPYIVQRIIVRGDGYLGFGMNNDAIRQYKKALMITPNNVDARNWLAYAYKRAGNPEESVKIYENSLRLNPNNIIAIYELGMYYASKKDFKKAKMYFLEACSIPREHAVAGREDRNFYYRNSMEMLAICQERLGEYGEAIRANERILMSYPDDIRMKEKVLKRIEYMKRLK